MPNRDIIPELNGVVWADGGSYKFSWEYNEDLVLNRKNTLVGRTYLGSGVLNEIL